MKSSLLVAAVALLTGFLVGCSSVPQHCNLSGTWNYTFEEKGRDGAQTGSMQLVQSDTVISGKANDAYGEFNVTGNIYPGNPKFTIQGDRNDGKRTFVLNATMTGENEFEGSYTTNQNTAGTLEAKRN